MIQTSRATEPTTRPTAIKICVAGLLTAACGIVIQYLTLPEDFPTVPPGPVVLIAAAAFVALAVRWWWSPFVGVGVALMIAIGGLVSGGVASNLTGSVGPAIGAGVMLFGLVATVVAGVATIAQTTKERGV